MYIRTSSMQIEHMGELTDQGESDTCDVLFSNN